MPGYHTGPAAHIGYLFGARHSHLDSAGYSIDTKSMTKSITAEQLVENILEEEQWRQIISSLVICFLEERFIHRNDIKMLKTFRI